MIPEMIRREGRDSGYPVLFADRGSESAAPTKAPLHPTLRLFDIFAGVALQHVFIGIRQNAPYLVQVINGRAAILDYGIKQGDGTWKLASDASTIYASRNDIVALAHAAGTEWRVEDIQHNPLADVAVEQIGVYFINGEVKDYTVQVTDNDGTFYVWARNLDRALQLQAKTGAAFEFNLRNYEVDLETFDEVNSTDDSTYRVELLTPAQFNFATSLGGIDFRSEMLAATYNNITGQLDYSVNGIRGAGRSACSEFSGGFYASNI